ncbi:synaptotagmin-6 [Garra rufa]|uniref:synaptotagmin-6 n=1 Tax=Garra rufa TaxID=137080 RepID=UPI003CCE8BE0
MTAAGKGHDMICQKAVSLIVDLCTQDSPRLDHNTCEEFLFLISNQEYNHKDSACSDCHRNGVLKRGGGSFCLGAAERKHHRDQGGEREEKCERKDTSSDIAVGLPIGVIIACGLALLLLAAFVSWKLCWVPWRNKALSSSSAALAPDDCPSFHLPSLLPSPQPSEVTMATEKEKYPLASMGFLEAAVKISHTSPDIPAEVELSMREHFLRRTQRMQRQTTEPASSTRHSSFKRHLPRQMQVSSLDLGDDYDVDEQPTSIGRIKPELYKQMTTENDESGNSKGGQNCGKINFSLRYDYENEMLLVKILKAFDLPAKDLCGSSDPYVKIYLLPDRKQKFQTRVHRKTLNPTFDESFQFPVPYDELPVRKLHLSVFDFDRFSRHDMIGEVILDNLFEVSDLSRETSIWKDIQYATSYIFLSHQNAPIYLFRTDLDSFYLVGHNEIIGVCRLGCGAEGLGRDHWNEMLAYPRKPIAHWHPLLEPKKSEKEWKARTASFDSQGSCPSPKPPASP